MINSCAPIFPLDMDKRIINLSSYSLSLVEKQSLCLGLDFSVSPKRSKQTEIDAAFEDLFLNLAKLKPSPSADLPLLKATLVSCAKKYGKSKIERSSLLPVHLDALNNLKNNADIVISKPDKGSGVVIMDRKDYVEKMTKLIDDPTKFQLDNTQKDTSIQTQKKLKKLVGSLSGSTCKIPKDLTSKLNDTSIHTARLYGLPKTHKPSIPLRPIVSMCSSPYEATSKWICQLLKPIEEHFTSHCLKDSFSFVDMLRQQIFPSTNMVSFDVVSLFTNVPVFETIDIITSFVEDNPHICPIPHDTLKELLRTCTTNVQFFFNGKYYRQIDGVAMGSSLGCLFANVFMGHMEQQLYQDISSICHMYFRYIDDTFIIVDDMDKAHQLLDIFNSYHRNLKFTFEAERNSSLAFLDVLVYRNENGCFDTRVFRKSTWTGVYTSFHSFVPLSYKRGLVRTLFYRSLRICSERFLDEEFANIKHFLQQNSYPITFIEKNMLTTLPTDVKQYGPDRKPVFLRLPFYGEKSSSWLRADVSRAVNSTFYAAKPIILFQCNRIPKASPKDPISNKGSFGVIYKFTCGCGDSYIGRTNRDLETRIKEHIPQWLLVGKYGKAQTSITRHCLTCNVDKSTLRQRFKIIAKSKCHKTLSILEALYIKSESPKLCVQKDYVYNLYLPWK